MIDKLNFETLIVQLLILLALALSFFPTIYYLSLAPATTVFPLVHSNDQDYFYYPSLIRQGMEGRWLVSSRFTPEAFPPQFAQTFFVVLGHLAKITKLDPPLVYTGSRLVFGLGLALSIYYLIRVWINIPWLRVVSLLLVLFGSGCWQVRAGTIAGYLTFWTAFDVRQRITFLPHHLFAYIMMVLTIIFLALLFQKNQWRFLLFACLTCLIGGLTNPITLANLALTLLVAGGLIIVFQLKNISKTKTTLIPIAACLFFIGLPLVYFFYLKQTTFPWTNYQSNMRAMVQYPVTVKDYLLGMGPAVFLSLLALPRLLKKRDRLTLMLVSWFIAPFIGIFVIAPITNTGNAYYFNAAHYIPIGIIGAVGINNLTQLLAAKLHRRQLSIVFLLVCLLSIYFSVYWHTSIKTETSRFQPRFFNLFPPRELIAGLSFLNQHSPTESVVLTGVYLGNLLPAYTHNRVVIGHQVNTYDIANKSWQVGNFYRQQDPQFAQSLIDKYQIAYVVYSYDTPPPDNEFINAVGLKPVFQNSAVTIFRSGLVSL